MKNLPNNRKQLLVKVLRYSIEILAFIPIFFILASFFFEPSEHEIDIIFVITIFSLIYFITFFSSLIIRLRKKWSSLDTAIVKINTGLSLGFLGLLIWGLSGIVYEKPPQFFPINDPQSTYTIVKYGDGYGIHYHTDQQTKLNQEKNCTLIKNKQICRITYNQDFTAPIGYSPVNLSDFSDTQVFVTGSFGPNGNGLVVFNIKTISKKLDIH